MNLDMRAYRDDNDIWRIREFLRGVYLANDRREHSWHVARFDYWRWHTVANCGQTLDNLFLWETRGGEIAAFLTTEGGGDAFLNVHPEARTASLEDEMVAVAEKHLAVPCTGGPSLVVAAREGDTLREDVLAARGYKRLEHCEDQRRLDLTGRLPE
ncbi:MAG: GNAT family N-acetyltransferase, partial [Thermotogota bacterium]